MKEITSITAVKQYFTDNTFELYITIVVMHFCSITKRQSTKKEQLPKVAQKTLRYKKAIYNTRFCPNNTGPPTAAQILLNI